MHYRQQKCDCNLKLKTSFEDDLTTVWNDLPLHVTSAPSLAVFRQRLKDLSVFPFLPRH